jgi:mycofactocin system creatininase family protein
VSALGDLAWPQVSERRRLLIVPLGATEQHGPHLPLSTDTEIAVALGRRLATAVAGACLAPALPFGASGEHQDFPGTLSIGGPATVRVLVELGRSACATFARVLLLCAHGGNLDALSEAVATLVAEGRDVRAWTPRWSGDAHAGELETSLMLAIAPERVAFARAAPGNSAPLRELLPALRARGVRAASPSGVLGDPTPASAAHGHTLLEAEQERMTRMVRAWLTDP